MRSWQYRQHYPEGTISAPAPCKQCKANTQHRIFNHRLSNVCIPCAEKQEAAHQERLLHPEPPQPVQQGLFA